MFLSHLRSFLLIFLLKNKNWKIHFLRDEPYFFKINKYSFLGARTSYGATVCPFLPYSFHLLQEFVRLITVVIHPLQDFVHYCSVSNVRSSSPVLIPLPQESVHLSSGLYIRPTNLFVSVGALHPHPSTHVWSKLITYLTQRSPHPLLVVRVFNL